MPDEILDGELKQKIETSALLSDAEKKQWLYLLPRMTAFQKNELRQILLVHMPASPVGGPASSAGGPAPSADGLVIKNLAVPKPPPAFPRKMDVTPPSATPSIPRPLAGPKIAAVKIIPPVPPPAKAPKSEPLRPPVPFPAAVPAAATSAPGLAELRALTPGDLQAGSSVYVFLEVLTKKMQDLRQRQHLPNEELLAAFEQSPLYEAYLTAGLDLMEGTAAAPLTREQFEALTDFRMTLKAVLKF